MFLRSHLSRPAGSEHYLLPILNVKTMEYTCADYRFEMILLNLKRRLQHEGLSEEERDDILLQIKKLEAKMGLE